ncbi:hypothetical protein L6164_037854 [Bauhinia variegata]|uniref:Uncharacterized protein n=1 Tax=Bauhinia variegata TaxID=167791 RepID=A0ACB9KL45_BAUVA|nr:hypothetical protein L6164_037854 [Bauhinia variegata]
MRDQETDREGNGLSIIGGPSLELNRSRSSQLSCLGSGIPSLVGLSAARGEGPGLPFQSISGRSVPLLVRVVRSLGLESSWGVISFS